MLLGAAQGLLALHRRGFIHRDIKSANIFIFADEDSGQPIARLGDYGSVLDTSHPSPSICQQLVGTASYLDPEAIACGHCSWSSDVFSFGVVMLEVLLCRSVTEASPGSRPLWRQLN